MNSRTSNHEPSLATANCEGLSTVFPVVNSRARSLLSRTGGHVWLSLNVQGKARTIAFPPSARTSSALVRSAREKTHRAPGRDGGGSRLDDHLAVVPPLAARSQDGLQIHRRQNPAGVARRAPFVSHCGVGRPPLRSAKQTAFQVRTDCLPFRFPLGLLRACQPLLRAGRTSHPAATSNTPGRRR